MAKNIVYFLGAGASYNFGIPLTSAIMPEILDKLRKGELFRLPPSQKTPFEEQQEIKLREAIYMLYPGLKNTEIRSENNYRNNKSIPNITEVLSFVDHSYVYNIPPHPALSDQALEDFRHLLNRAIFQWLIQYNKVSTHIDDDSCNYNLNLKEQYYTDAQKTLLNRFLMPVKHNIEQQTTVITTNYDLTIDNEFRQDILDNRVDLGIPYRDASNNNIILQPANPLLKYYKLHGSLNWARCDLCGYYYINPMGNITFQVYREEVDQNNTCVCSDTLKLKSVLIAPSIVRDIRDSNLLQIWKGALESIRVADEIVFIGYSLPAEDLAIKSIIMRGLNGRCSKIAPVIKVVQYGRDAEANYYNLFGSAISHYFDEGLEQYLNSL